MVNIFFSVKKICLRNLWSEKLLAKKKFFVNKNFCQWKNFYSENFLSPKIFWQRKFFVSENVLSVKIFADFGQDKKYVNEIFWLPIFYHQKCYHKKMMVGEKILVSKILISEKILVSKNFYGSFCLVGLMKLNNKFQVPKIFLWGTFFGTVLVLLVVKTPT